MKEWQELDLKPWYEIASAADFFCAVSTRFPGAVASRSGQNGRSTTRALAQAWRSCLQSSDQLLSATIFRYFQVPVAGSSSFLVHLPLVIWFSIDPTRHTDGDPGTAAQPELWQYVDHLSTIRYDSRHCSKETSSALLRCKHTSS